MPDNIRDVSRPVATDRDRSQCAEAEQVASRALDRLEEENTFLRDQIRTKDKQIDALLERDRETNILVNIGRRCGWGRL